jgi:hypothetical protein
MKYLTKTLVTVVAAILVNAAIAQSGSPQVHSSGGAQVTAGTQKISFTVGQAIGGTYAGSTRKVTIGFQQPIMIDSTTCVGDFDNSGYINIADLLIFFSNFGCTSACGNTDMDENGTVNITDLLQLISVFGTSCS